MKKTPWKNRSLKLEKQQRKGEGRDVNSAMLLTCRIMSLTLVILSVPKQDLVGIRLCWCILPVLRKQHNAGLIDRP